MLPSQVTRLLVGFAGADVAGVSRPGTAYEYVNEGGTWNLQNRLVAYDAAAGDQLGSDVGIDGRNMVCGAYAANINSLNDVGAVYLFTEVAPAPVLHASDDTGISNADQITMRQDLSFDVRGITNGATVQLLRDDLVVDSQPANTPIIVMRDPAAPSAGTFYYTVQQIVGGQPTVKSPATRVTIDTTPPTVTIGQAPGQIDPTASSQMSFQYAFSEPVIGFDTTHIWFGNSTANLSNGRARIEGDTIIVTGAVSDGQFVQADILANAATDPAGNGSLESTTTDNRITVDTISPTVTVEQAINQPDPTASLPLNYTVTFSEPVVFETFGGFFFDGSGADMSKATIQVTGSGAIYNVAVNGVEANSRTVTLSLLSRVAHDALGNQNLRSTSIDNTITLDNVGPSVTVSVPNTQRSLTARLPVNFTVTFSEPVSGFDRSRLSFVGSTANTRNLTTSVSGSGSVYNVSVANVVPKSGTIELSILAGAAIRSSW